MFAFTPSMGHRNKIIRPAVRTIPNDFHRKKIGRIMFPRPTDRAPSIIDPLRHGAVLLTQEIEGVRQFIGGSGWRQLDRPFPPRIGCRPREKIRLGNRKGIDAPGSGKPINEKIGPRRGEKSHPCFLPGQMFSMTGRGRGDCKKHRNSRQNKRHAKEHP